MNKSELENIVRSAQDGDAGLQYCLGARLMNGDGLAANPAAGAYWYARAIEKGHTEAKWNLGVMIVEGDLPSQPSVEIGMALIQEAAHAGEPDACAFLAKLYRGGKIGGVPDEIASNFWATAAEWSEENIKKYKEFGVPHSMAFTLGLVPAEPPRISVIG